MSRLKAELLTVARHPSLPSWTSIMPRMERRPTGRSRIKRTIPAETKRRRPEIRKSFLTPRQPTIAEPRKLPTM